jgi:Na+-driven multidrug efflux pump
VLFGIVRSTGAVLAPLIIPFISLFCVRIAFAELLEPIWGTDAIWWSFPVSMTLAIAYCRWGGWRKAKMGAGRASTTVPQLTEQGLAPPTTAIHQARNGS